jgi:hypothetical protein
VLLETLAWDYHVCAMTNTNIAFSIHESNEQDKQRSFEIAKEIVDMLKRGDCDERYANLSFLLIRLWGRGICLIMYTNSLKTQSTDQLVQAEFVFDRILKLEDKSCN